MPDTWFPLAEKHDLKDREGYGDCDPNYPPKAIPHITWDKNGTISHPIDLVPFSHLVSYFTGEGSNRAPHILWNPFTGEFAQFYPATSRSKSLEDHAGGTRTNRAGKVVIQIEALYFPYCRWNGKVYAKLKDTPCKNWPKLQDWVHSWGVPNVWPMGVPDGMDARASEKVWETKGGWYGHSQVPENSHTDPLSWPPFVNTSTVKTVPPFPGRQFFYVGAVNNHVTEVDKNLIRLHFTKHNDGNGYQAGPLYSEYTRENVRDFQRAQGWSGSGADGLVGPETWHKLFVL